MFTSRSFCDGMSSIINFKLHLVQRGLIDFYQTCLQAFNPFGLDVGTNDFLFKMKGGAVIVAWN